jgi:GNAT superfamily N-acetyltransferase
LDTREASRECAKVISARPYENYTIFGNVLSFENPETMQPNRIYLLADRDRDPHAVATVEDGRRSTEVALFSRRDQGARRIFEEALLLADSLRAPDLQVVASSTAQEHLLHESGIRIEETGDFLVLTLRSLDCQSMPQAHAVQAVVSVGGLPVRHPRTVTRTLLEDGNVVCLGRAEPRGDNLYEICDLFTVPERRGEGLASSVAAWLCEYVISIGRVPVYVVAEGNVASRKIAARLGFGHRARFSVHSAHKRRKRQGEVEMLHA